MYPAPSPTGFRRHRPKVEVVAAQWGAARFLIEGSVMPNQRQSNDKQEPQSSENIQQGGQQRDQSPGQQEQSRSSRDSSQQQGGGQSLGRDQNQQQGGKSSQQGSKNR
jgi:hypothetical protein